jgi:hypothetical protein
VQTKTVKGQLLVGTQGRGGQPKRRKMGAAALNKVDRPRGSRMRSASCKNACCLASSKAETDWRPPDSGG